MLKRICSGEFDFSNMRCKYKTVRPSPMLIFNASSIGSTIQERTGMISGLEKVEALKVQRNGTIESDVSGSDFWFYLIEPGTLRIVTSDDPRLRSALFEHRAQSSLLDVISQTLGRYSIWMPAHEKTVGNFKVEPEFI